VVPKASGPPSDASGMTRVWDHVGQNIANLAVVAVDANAPILVRCLGRCDFVIDVIGYYQ
jgi:hypothetical protein